MTQLTDDKLREIEHSVYASKADYAAAIAERDEAKAECERLREQVAHQTACINAQSETCAKYAEQLKAAVGAMRRAYVGDNPYRDLKEFLAEYDAEQK